MSTKGPQARLVEMMVEHTEERRRGEYWEVAQVRKEVPLVMWVRNEDGLGAMVVIGGRVSFTFIHISCLDIFGAWKIF